MDNLSQVVSAIPDTRAAAAVKKALKGVYDRMSCQMLSNSTLVITATAGLKVPKTGAAISYGVLKGRMLSIAAGVDMPALSGTVTNAKFNVFCFFANIADESLTAANMVSAMGVEGATMELVKFPAFPENKTLIGYIIINPTGTGNFVGNTTALNDATVIPGTAYISPVGPFDPTALY